MITPGHEGTPGPSWDLSELQREIAEAESISADRARELRAALADLREKTADNTTQQEIDTLLQELEAKIADEVLDEAEDPAREIEEKSLSPDEAKEFADEIDAQLQYITDDINDLMAIGVSDLRQEFQQAILNLVMPRIQRFRRETTLPADQVRALIDKQTAKINQLRQDLGLVEVVKPAAPAETTPKLKRLEETWTADDLPKPVADQLRLIGEVVVEYKGNKTTLPLNDLKLLRAQLEDRLQDLEPYLIPGGPIYREYEDPAVVVNTLRSRFIREDRTGKADTAETILKQMDEQILQAEDNERGRQEQADRAAREAAAQRIVDRLNLAPGAVGAIPEFSRVQQLIADGLSLLPTDNPQPIIDGFETAIPILESFDLQPLTSAVVPALDQENLSKINDVKSKLVEAGKQHLRDLQERKETAEAELTKKERAWQRILTAWDQIFASEKLTKDQTANDARINAPYTGNNIETAGIFPLLEEFFPERVHIFAKLRNLHDGFNNAAGTDIFKQLVWANAIEARIKVGAHASFRDLKEFRSETEKFHEAGFDTQGIFDRVEELFSGNFQYWIVRGERKPVPVGTPGAEEVNFNFGREGDPNEDDQKKGMLTVMEILSHEFPEAPKPILTGVMYSIIIGELRLKYFRRYYSNYTKSPDPTFDPGVIFGHSPMDAISYNIRSKGMIYPEHRVLFQVLRMPPRTAVFYESAVDADENPLMAKEKIKNPKEAAFPEYLPAEVIEGIDPTTGRSIKKTDPINTFRSVANKNMREALEVRLLQDRALTTSYEDFTPVQLSEDLTILPYFWDVAYGDKYGALTYEEYRKSMEAWLAFIKYIQSPKTINNKKMVNEAIKDAVAKISPMKGLFALFSNGNAEAQAEGVRFKMIITQMLLRYVKNIFDQYEIGARYGKSNALMHSVVERRVLSKRNYFLHQTIFEINKMKTLDYDIKHDLLHLLEHYLNSPSHLFRDNLFSSAKENVIRYASPAEVVRRESLIEAYLRDPTEEDTKGSH